MATPADGNVSQPVFTSADRISVSSVAVELLRSCVPSGIDGKVVKEEVVAAVTLICAEARRAQATPEQLVISIKELCHSLPEFASIRGARERGAFLDTVVKLTIEEFYRP